MVREQALAELDPLVVRLDRIAVRWGVSRSGVAAPRPDGDPLDVEESGDFRSPPVLAPDNRGSPAWLPKLGRKLPASSPSRAFSHPATEAE